jgi:glycosyltransferase involved in cell wall biosynthesis
VAWDELPRLISRLDVNLAPLEDDNPFAECKSAIKYVEAGFFGVPTVASPIPDFQRAITDRTTGMLAGDAAEWHARISELVADPPLRRRIGAAAKQDVVSGHTVRARAAESYERFSSLAGRSESIEPLVVNWVLFSPIAKNSGGYRNILRIAGYLSARGHSVRLCIEPIAHLALLNADEVHEYLEEAFGPQSSEIILGHRRIPEADVSIATFWRTAETVAAHGSSLFKAYYIQDFEPEFYEETDVQYRQAARSYFLPLRHICLGAHLAQRVADYTHIPSDSIDFALDPAFKLQRDPGERGDTVRILFFARPSLRRRGYDVGIKALEELKSRRPDCEVFFFGSPDDELGDVPFPFTNLGVLGAEDVARAMNDSHILLTFSLTNISNVPYEGMACGCAVVDLDLPNVSMMVNAGSNCLLSPLDPSALSRTLSRLVDDAELRHSLGRQGASDMQARTWDRTGSQFEEILTRLCFTRLSTSRMRWGSG